MIKKEECGRAARRSAGHSERTWAASIPPRGELEPLWQWAGGQQAVWAVWRVLGAPVQLAFFLPIGGSKNLHYPREPGCSNRRSSGLPEELQLGHHQGGAGGQATAQGLLRALQGQCLHRDCVYRRMRVESDLE